MRLTGKPTTTTAVHDAVNLEPLPESRDSPLRAASGIGMELTF